LILKGILPVLGLALVLASCGADEKQAAPPPPRLPPALAERLAAQSEAVVSSLEAGDSCAAAERAGELENAVAAAIRDGAVPAPLQGELRSVTRALALQITCEPPPEGSGKAKNEKDKDADEEEEDD
jgi:hypothetical protein